MKLKEFIPLLIFALPFFGCAQTNACLNKTFGFSRVVVGGAPPSDIVEVGGKVVGTTGSSGNKEFLLYLQTCVVSSVTVTGLWINGAGYSAKAEKARTPVIVSNTSSATKSIDETLIKKTSLSVWNLVLTPDDTLLKPSASTQKLITSNAVVITGILKGKPFTTSLKTLKELQPFAAQ